MLPKQLCIYGSSMLVAAVLLVAGSCRPRERDRSAGQEQAPAAEPPTRTAVLAPSVTETKSASTGESMPRFAKNSPFAGDYKLETEPQGKRLWARSFLWEQAPPLAVEKWLTPQPDMQGKYLLIEHWATWCGPCRRSIGLLNEIHRRFQDQLVVIGISDESEGAVRALESPRVEYPVAIDPQARMKMALGVVGIPHVIIVEPQGFVVWEGFPLLQGHELTVETVARILAVNAQSGSAREP